MPNLPQIDFVGLGGYYSLLLVFIATLWGVNKAILISKGH